MFGWWYHKVKMPIIVKGDGEREAFAVEKLIQSLAHAGAEQDLAEEVAEEIAEGVRDEMTTTEIYKKAFQLLHKHEHVVAARYSMRRAILELGPTGFPFEDYIGELMRAKGYATRTRVVVRGRCAEHEVDVVMEKDDTSIGAELKFHNTPGFKTDIKTALYVRARYWDIQWGAEDRKEKAGIDEGWLITNTKFTVNAVEYAMCAGIKLLGWSYPDKGNLADLIRETKVYPITILTSLSSADKARLLEGGITMCHKIADNPRVLEQAGITGKKHDDALKESRALCAI